MFTVNIPHIDRPEPATKAIIADRRLYLTADDATVVEHGDVRAAFLLAGAGGAIAGVDVDRLSLSVVDGRVTQASPAPLEPESGKQSSPDDDKQALPSGDKSDKTKRERK